MISLQLMQCVKKACQFALHYIKCTEQVLKVVHLDRLYNVELKFPKKPVVQLYLPK